MRKNDEQKVNKLKKEKVKKEKTKKIPKRDNASRQEKKTKIPKIKKVAGEKRKSGNSVLSQYCDAAGGRFPDSGYWCAGSWYYLLQ